MNRKVPQYAWNVVALFFTGWLVTASWLLLDGDDSPIVRLAFGFCGTLGLHAASVGGGLRYIVKLRFPTWAICLLLAGFLASVFLPVFAGGYDKARASSSHSALKRYGIALVLYAQDNKGCLPKRLGSEKMYLQLTPYFGSGVDNSLPKVDPASGKLFVWRRSLGGVHISDVKAPDKVILAYTQPYKNLTYCRSVLFLDGHVKQYSVDSFWAVWRDQPMLPMNQKQGNPGRQPIH